MIKKYGLLQFIALGLTVAFNTSADVSDIAVEVTSLITTGTGCPNGSVHSTISSDGTSVTLTFNEYQASTDDTTQIALSDCNYAMAFRVQAGYAVGLVTRDWKGTMITSPGAFINFHREYFHEGYPGSFRDSNWEDVGYEEFTIKDDPAQTVYSGCDGTGWITRADTGITIIGYNNSLLFDSLGAQLLMKFDIRKCE